MILVMEIVFLVVGLIVVISGRVKLSGDRVVEGAAARVAGLLLVLDRKSTRLNSSH